jgi:hypothetical protein
MDEIAGINKIAAMVTMKIRLELPLSATPPSNHRRWATDARLRHESELPNFGLVRAWNKTIWMKLQVLIR